MINNINISGNTFRLSSDGDVAIKIDDDYGPNITISKNIFGIPFSGYHQYIEFNGVGTGVLIEKNIFDYVMRFALLFDSDVSGVKIFNNIFSLGGEDAIHFSGDASNGCIINNTIRNYFTNGIVCAGEFTDVDVLNNIIKGENFYGTGISVGTYTSGVLDCNNVYGFETLYAIYSGTVFPGSKSMSAEPQFESDNKFIHDVYAIGLLKSDSPCIDAGVGIGFNASVPTDDFRDGTRPISIPGNWIVPDGTSDDYWSSIRMSPDGKYHVAISGGSGSSGYLNISVDYGKAFTRKGDERVWWDVAISLDGSYIVAVSSDGIYLSTDKGDTWTKKGDDGIYICAKISESGQYVTIASGGSGTFQPIFVSNDYGENFTQIPVIHQVLGIAMSSDGKHQSVVLANGFYRVYVSDDYGATWSSQHDWTEPEGYICETIAMSSDGVIRVIGCYNKFLYSDNSGVDYSEIVVGGDHYRDVSMSYDSNEILVCADNGVYLSEDGGGSFRLVYFGFPLTNVLRCATSSNGKRMSFAVVHEYLDNLVQTYGDLYEYGVAVDDGTDIGAIECTAREVGLRPEIYFVNDSGSNTSPYDTPGKGATSLLMLFNGNSNDPPYDNTVPFYENDIVEVVSGSEINNSLYPYPEQIPLRVKIRSYFLNSEKPIIRINKDSALFACCSFENIRFYKNGDDIGDFYVGAFIIKMPDSFNGLSVCGCEFECKNILIGSRIGMAVVDIYKCKDAIVENNIFINTIAACVAIESWGGGSERVVVANNNTYRACAGSIIDNYGPRAAIMIDNTGGVNSKSLIFNNIIFRESDGKYCVGILLLGDNLPVPFSSSGGIDYNCIYGVSNAYLGVSHGEHDIFVDPKFKDVTVHDFRLLFLSKCIDNGVGSIDVDRPKNDCRGVWRPKLVESVHPVNFDDGTDIGAFEMIFEEFSVLGGKLIILENGRSYVRGDAKWCTDYFSPFAKEMISISGAKSQDDNGDFDIKYVTFDGKYSRVYLRNHEFSVNDDDVIVRFMDRKRDWVKISGDGSYAPGSMWEGDKIVIGTGGANDGEYVLSNIGFDVDGLPIAEIDRNAVATERVLCNELRPQKSTEYIAPKYNLIQMSRVTEYNSIGRYDDIITFDEEVDAPFVAITNRFLVRFLSLPNNELLTNALLDRMTRRIKLLSPIGSIFEGFAYRVSYENANKISLTQGQYDGAENMHVGVEMDGTISFDDGVDPKKIVGDGTLFKSQIVAGDSIIIGVDGGGYKIIMTVASVIDDVTLETADNLVGSTTGLKIAREMYQKRVVKYSESPSVEYPYTRYFIRSEIPSSESNDPVVWPKTDKMIVRACVSPDPFDHPYYVTPLTSKEVVPSFVKLDRMTIFFIFEVEIV